MQIHLLTFLKAVFQVRKTPETLSLMDARKTLSTAIRVLDTLAFWNQGKLDQIVGSSNDTAIIKTYWSFL